MMAPDLMQSLPADGGPWVLIAGDIRTCPLTYKSSTTGQTIRVPNVWYNQPPAWRASALRFYAARNREVAAVQSLSPDGWRRRDAAESLRRAERLESKADQIERTGVVTA